MEKLPAKLEAAYTEYKPGCLIYHIRGDEIDLGGSGEVETILQLANLARQFIRQIAVLKVSQIVVKKVGDKTVDLALDIPREIKTVGLPPWGKLR